MASRSLSALCHIYVMLVTRQLLVLKKLLKSEEASLYLEGTLGTYSCKTGIRGKEKSCRVSEKESLFLENGAFR